MLIEIAICLSVLTNKKQISKSNQIKSNQIKSNQIKFHSPERLILNTGTVEVHPIKIIIIVA
jgi:hypothetical protein